MKQCEFNKHTGPFRVMSVDAGFAGFIVAIGIVVLAVVSIPEAKRRGRQRWNSVVGFDCGDSSPMKKPLDDIFADTNSEKPRRRGHFRPLRRL